MTQATKHLPKPVNPLIPGGRPELEVLLVAVHTEMATRQKERLRELVREYPLDWSFLIRSAHRHRVMPLLYWNLKKTCWDDVPEEVGQVMENFFRDNLQRNLFLTNALLEAVEKFDEKDVLIVPFKGPALASSAYGNLGLRQYDDLDILIRKEDYAAARDILYDAGYFLDDDLKSDYHYRFIRRDEMVVMELHWGITPSYFPFNMPPGWEKRLREAEINGEPVSILSPEDLLLILCVHGTKHLWSRISWVADINELIRANPGLDWETTLAKARQLGCERMLYAGLLLAMELLDADLPKKVARRVREDQTVEGLVNRLYEMIFQEPKDTYLSFYYYFQLKIRERWRDKYPYLLHWAPFLLRPNEKDRAFLKVPRALSFVHYFVRPVRLARKFLLRTPRRN